LGIGDWGLGIGGLGVGAPTPTPPPQPHKPQPPIQNPQFSEKGNKIIFKIYY